MLGEYIKHFLLHVNRKRHRKRTIPLNKILRYFRDTSNTYLNWKIGIEFAMPTGNRAYLNEIDTTNILGDEMSNKKTKFKVFCE